MKTVNMHEAKTHLSRLVAAAVAGEPFVIAKAGKPLVKVEPIEEQKPKTRRLGFGIGKMPPVPDEFFDPTLDKEIEALFHAEDPELAQAMDALARAQAEQGQAK